MATRAVKSSAPLTFDLPVRLVEKIQAIKKTRRLTSASEVVRLAVEEFDFDGCKPKREASQQISVRVAAAQRVTLQRYARGKDSSIGELVRLALEGLTVKPARNVRGGRR